MRGLPLTLEWPRSADLIALERRLVEREAEPGLSRYHEQAALDGRRLLLEPERPRHVLDGEAVGNGRDEMDVDLRHEVAHHGEVERLGHAGDLHPLRDAAHAQEVDHHDVDRARFQQMAEGYDAVVVFT